MATNGITCTVTYSHTRQIKPLSLWYKLPSKQCAHNPNTPPMQFYYAASSQPSPATNATKPPPPHVDFPTSPQSAVEDEVTIQHYIHPNHPLAQITVPADLYVCGGCKEYGSGKRFTCHDCNFQLHEFCALSPRVLRGHALHPQHQLVFHSRPKKAGISWSKCDVCGKSIKGFTFRCRACNFQMHPCCAMLSTEITFPPPLEAVQGSHRHSLKLLPPGATSSNSNPASTSSNNGTGGGGAVCGACKKKRSGGRIYRCTLCSYHLHALCAKATINGLHADGITAPPEKPKFMGTAARLASQVVTEFIGGIIAGLGEGVGQALVGRSHRRLRRPTA